VNSAEPRGRDGRQTRCEAHKTERRKLVVRAALAEIDENEPGAELVLQRVADRRVARKSEPKVSHKVCWRRSTASSRTAPPQVRAAFLQQRDAFDVVRHREDADATERERDPLRSTAFMRGNWPLTCGFIASDRPSHRYLSATLCNSKRAQSAPSDWRLRWIATGRRGAHTAAPASTKESGEISETSSRSGTSGCRVGHWNADTSS
jgi:hypothetical protein